MSKIRRFYFTKLISLLLTGLLWVHTSSAQTPVGKFLADTIELGKPFRYSLSFLHPSGTEVFFPDTSFNFFPFEVLGQDYFTTRTNQKGSLDSTIYTLITFEVQPEQLLKTPIFVQIKGDCTAVYSNPDTVYLRLRIASGDQIDTVRFQPLDIVLPLKKQFNYSFFFGVIISFGLSGLAIYWLFGSAMNRLWNMLLLRQRHADFVRSFNRLSKSANEKGILADAEKAVVIWKNFLEKVEQKPFATYTTREIIDNIPDESLNFALKDMDGVIYGQVKSASMGESLKILKAVGLRVYRNKRREIAES